MRFHKARRPFPTSLGMAAPLRILQPRTRSSCPHLPVQSQSRSRSAPSLVLPGTAQVSANARLLQARRPELEADPVSCTRARSDASQDPRTNPTAFHTLESLLLAVQLRDAPLPHYLRTATSSNLPFLSVIDRAPVIDYLTGKRDQWDGVAPLGGDVSAPVLGDVNEGE